MVHTCPDGAALAEGQITTDEARRRGVNVR